MAHGFDERKLAHNLDRLLGEWVESGRLPGVQALVARRGDIAYRARFGVANLERREPLRDDSIFRIYSMTKVFTAVAACQLLEEGRFAMYDPLSRYIPEFASTRVAGRSAAGGITLVPPRREIIVHDLFTMGTGFPYPGELTPSERGMAALFRRAEAAGKRGAGWSAVDIARAIAKVPASFHPGEHWLYGMSIDLLGALVEVISGQRLGDFMSERIFTPLGLADTGFYLPADKADRLVTLYEVDDRDRFTPARFDVAYPAPPAAESGGGGLLSTLDDVARFATLLLGEGRSGATRLLSRKTVELMRTNHLTDQQLADYTWDTQRGYGYGLGVRVMRHPEVAGYGSVGEFAWDGMAGTWFAVDPAEEMIAVFLVQTNPGRHYQFVPRFAQTVYGAIND
ncbi:MAG: beta-lactamase family protein [Propionibacteriaceae bacterium]|jgi:CubicO group peptidase (beta-lactamase class C family)|nr:beta-lactamase family protein [Propionibacteriaceae bacterium]